PPAGMCSLASEKSPRPLRDCRQVTWRDPSANSTRRKCSLGRRSSRMCRDRRNFTFGKPGLVIIPTHFGLAGFHRYHGDAIIHRTDQRAKVAANAIILTDLRNWFAWHAPRTEAIAIWVHQINALVRAVLARDVAKIAANALVVIDSRNALIVQIERFPFLERGNRQPAKLRDRSKPLGRQIIVQTLDHVRHDSKTIMHYRRADLH